MNRRRVLNSVHRSIARKGINAAAWFAGQSFTSASRGDMPLERLSIPDLDRVAPILVTPERIACPDCCGSGETIQADGNPNLPTPCEECHGRGYYEESL